MKTYKHLTEKLISEENILTSLHTALSGDKAKGTKRRIRNMLNNADIWVPKLRQIALNFHNFSHTPKEIYDGVKRKKRKILVPRTIELVVQHMVVNTLKDFFLSGAYEHSYASMTGRGGHKGKKYIEKWIRKDPKNTKYCLKVDIHHFFESIDQRILKSMLATYIKDDTFLRLMFKIIDADKQGLPLGFFTSQWLANWYLQRFDHYVKEVLGVRHYARYMDDMVFFGSNKRKLHQLLFYIQEYLHNNLNLELKGNYQVIRIGVDKSNFIDFMGFRFYADRIILRRSIMLSATKTARRIYRKRKVTTITVYDARRMLAYKGWIEATKVYHMYEKHIKLYVSLRSMCKIVSRYDKKRRLKCGTQPKAT